MCNVTIAKSKLQVLKTRTEKYLYELETGSMDFMSMTKDTFYKVKMICNDNDYVCPLYKYGSEIKFKQDNNPSIFTVLRVLANKHGIYLDYTQIPR